MTDPSPQTASLVTVQIREDEAKALGNERCKCGHLYGLHTSHCCSFCNVEGCDCAD